jgi:hypothetical protein
MKIQLRWKKKLQERKIRNSRHFCCKPDFVGKGKNTFIALYLKNINKKFELSAKPLNVIIFQISLHQ